MTALREAADRMAKWIVERHRFTHDVLDVELGIEDDGTCEGCLAVYEYEKAKAEEADAQHE